MQANDSTDPAEIGNAAKRFFSNESSGNFRGVSTPKCTPICTVNEHVLRWLLQPDRQRYLSSVCTEIVIIVIFYNFIPIDVFSGLLILRALHLSFLKQLY